MASHITGALGAICCCASDVHVVILDDPETYPSDDDSCNTDRSLEEGCPLPPCRDDPVHVDELRGLAEDDMPQIVGRVREPPDVCSSAPQRTAFEMDSTMLRGVRTNVVLRQRAKLLSNAAGSEATYLLSKPTDHLGAFISHNWCVSRWRKWLALSLQYNFCSAFASGIFTATILCVATSLGYLPLVPVEFGQREYHTMYCGVCGFLVFHAVLLFGPDLLPGWFMRGEMVFLDKACIHQVDLALQRKGIESLGGFLFYSWSMVVLYTRTYTKKLWTVYEMACFVCLHPGGRLEWLPVDLPPAVFAGSLAMWIFHTVFWLSTVASVREVFAVPSWFSLAMVFPGIVAVVLAFRKVARDQSASDADLRQFSIGNALCAVESDRVVVERNLASLMRDLNLVPADSTHEDALAAFDVMVQDTMSQAMRDSMGRVGLHYEHVLTTGAAYIFSMFDVVGGYVFAGSKVQLVIATIVAQIVYALSLFPLFLAFMMHLSRCFTCLTGVAEIAFVLLICLVSFSVYFLTTVSVVFLHATAEDDAFALVILCLLSSALSCFTYLVFRRPRWISRRRRAGTASETLEHLAEAHASHNRVRS